MTAQVLTGGSSRKKPKRTSAPKPGAFEEPAAAPAPAFVPQAPPVAPISPAPPVVAAAPAEPVVTQTSPPPPGGFAA